MPFDPYYKWLGISSRDQPPTHYRLLAIELFESDPDVIDAAADRQMTYLRQCATGSHVAESQKLLNEVSAARLCLLTSEMKRAYDAELKQNLLAANQETQRFESLTAVSSPAALAATKAPAPVVPTSVVPTSVLAPIVFASLDDNQLGELPPVQEAPFDPYHKWLGIPPEEQPPNHYRLLGIAAFESDPDVIDAAVEQRMTFLRACASGPHAAASKQLLTEVFAARRCLFGFETRRVYDAELKQKFAAPRQVQPSQMKANQAKPSHVQAMPEAPAATITATKTATMPAVVAAPPVDDQRKELLRVKDSPEVPTVPTVAATKTKDASAVRKQGRVPYFQQRRAYKYIEAVGGRVMQTLPGGPAWLRMCVGNTVMKVFDRISVVKLSETRITDEGLAQLRGLTEIVGLWLNGTRITDAGLAYLSGMTRLTRLDLAETGITDAGVAHLCKLTNLKFLHIPGTQVSDSGVETLLESLPECEIVF